jgi:hypothetical protein
MIDATISGRMIMLRMCVLTLMGSSDGGFFVFLDFAAKWRTAGNAMIARGRAASEVAARTRS